MRERGRWRRNQWDHGTYGTLERQKREWGWTTVRSRHERRGGGWRGKNNIYVANSSVGKFKDVHHNYTSFFFTNFPERYSTRDMYEVFVRHGHVHEVYILARRNASGRRFGFVRFVGVKEPERLAVFLDNIFVENEKIHVSLPSFQRHNDMVQRPKDRKEQQTKNMQQVWKKKRVMDPLQPVKSLSKMF